MLSSAVLTALTGQLVASGSSAGGGSGAGGLTGFVLDVIDALGAVGVAFLVFLEVIFPPIPSEVVLPLAGYQVQRGSIDLVAVVLLATLGSYLGSLVLYGVGAVIGIPRAARIADRIPLVQAQDVHAADGWFTRHDAAAVFFGRLVPGVRSLISLPAGAARMPLWRFSLFTVAGSGLWNGLLIGLGLALGTQYRLVEQHSHVIDYVVYAVIAAVVLFAVVRRIRRERAPGRPA